MTSHRIIVALLLAAPACASSTANLDLTSVVEHADAPRPAVDAYNLDESLAIEGYDPVSYFDGTPPVQGLREHAVRHRGVVYFFANDTNRDTFLASPRKYEPAYGGWCAWAMAHGGKTVDPDPTNFTLEDGVVHLFYRNPAVDTRNKWQKGDVAALRSDAAREWSNSSGEPQSHLALR